MKKILAFISGMLFLSTMAFAAPSASVTSTFTTTADATSQIGNNRGLNTDFNISISGTWAGAIILQRRFTISDSTYTDWLAVTNASWTANYEGQFSDNEAGVQYRLYASSISSGSADVRISR